MALIFLLLPPLLSSLVDAEYKLARPRRKAEVLVFDLVWLADAPVLIFLLLPPLLFSLAPIEDELACHSGEAEVLISYLADVARALAHLRPSWCMLAFDLAASPEPQSNLSKQRRLMKHFLSVVFACTSVALLLPSAMLEQLRSR
jgi:hypothetical protein